MIFQFLFGQLGAILHLIQQNRHFIGFQPDDLFFVALRQGNQCCRVFLNAFTLKVVVIEASQSGELSCLSTFFVGDVFTILLIQTHIVQIFFDIRSLYHIQYRQRKLSDFHFIAISVFFMEKFKKKTDIIGIGEPGSRGSIGFDATEEISAERRKRIQHFTQL